MIEVTKYHRSRHWAVYLDGELLAVTVYKKGALAVAATLRGLIAKSDTTQLHTC